MIGVVDDKVLCGHERMISKYSIFFLPNANGTITFLTCLYEFFVSLTPP